LNAVLRDRVETAEDGDETDEDEGEESAGPPDLEPIAEGRVGFEDFQELDIRVGEIEMAEPIEDAEDLVRLEVDLGVETRQLVAGIKQLHDVESLPGTRVVVLANLEPAELFGVESNGMLLAAGPGADLLTTLGDSEPGTQIR
jgi:methionyl-tRNA synthetase